MYLPLWQFSNREHPAYAEICLPVPIPTKENQFMGKAAGTAQKTQYFCDNVSTYFHS